MPKIPDAYFRDGFVALVQKAKIVLSQLDFYLRITDEDLKPQTGQYARISSATREDYKANGGAEDIGSKDDRKPKWLEVVRELYKKAWRSDHNELIEMWARSHLE